LGDEDIFGASIDVDGVRDPVTEIAANPVYMGMRLEPGDSFASVGMKSISETNASVWTGFGKRVGFEITIGTWIVSS